jgi:lysozyme family protein
VADSDILDSILAREGGFVNDPQDLGGATNMGITARTLAAYRGRPVTTEDVRALTRDEAREIYRSNYIAPFAWADDEFRHLLADSAVQHGVGRVNGWLEEVGRDYAAVLARRLRFYGEIITARPANAKFAKGWLARVARFVR